MWALLPTLQLCQTMSLAKPEQPLVGSSDVESPRAGGRAREFSLGATNEVAGHSRWLLLLPLLMVLGLFLFSPNFQAAEGERNAPLGGDFLQEWTAGKILGSTRADELYQIEYFRAVQHDSELVGFEWSESSYFPPVYPPFYYLLMSPFAALSFPVAVKAWAVCSALFLMATGELLWRFYEPFRKLFSSAILLAMIFIPLWVCLNLGQKSTLILLIMTGTFLLLRHGQPTKAGLVFALMAFKPHLAIVIGLAMLWKRQWRFVAGAGVGVGLLGLVSLSCGWQVNLDFLKVCLGGGDYIATGGYQLAEAHSIWGAVAFLVGGPGWVANGLTILIVGGVVALLAQLLKGALEFRSARFELQFAALVIATVLLSPHLYFYDLVMVLLPLLLIVCNLSGLEPSRPLKLRPKIVLGLKVAVGLFLVGAGAFVNVATATRLQPSVILMVAMVWMLATGIVSKGRLKRVVKSF